MKKPELHMCAIRCLMCNRSSAGLKAIDYITVVQFGTWADSLTFPLHPWLNSNREIFVLAMYCSSMCQVKAEWDWTKLLRLTWKQDSEGTEARWKFSFNFPPALTNWMEFSPPGRRITSSRFSGDCTPCLWRNTAEKTFKSSLVLQQSRYSSQETGIF